MHLETNPEDQPQDRNDEDAQSHTSFNQKLTGKEIEIGQSAFDLAEYARDATTTRKLYVTAAKDIYIEVNVKSR